MNAVYDDPKRNSSKLSDTIQRIRNVSVSPVADANLRFLLQHYLPSPNDTTNCVRTMQFNALLDRIVHKSDHERMYIPCGSLTEWLCLPYQQFDSNCIVIPATKLYCHDIDLLRCNGFKAVKARLDAEENYSEHSKTVVLMKQLENTHEGYVVLQMISNIKPGQPCEWCNVIGCSEACDVGPIKLKDGTIYCLKNGRMKLQKLLQTGTSNSKVVGPAIKTRLTVINDVIEADVVDCIFCPEWPPMADEWVTRQRHISWPSASTIEEIVKMGCCVVPVGYTNSIHQHYEWRVSFSQPEVLLSRTLNNIQRKSLLIVKTWLHASLKDPEVLSSYHLKTVLFWRCESISEDTWTESNMADHVLGMLDTLIYCLGNRILPHYFMPRHNLFDHINPDDVEIIKNKAESFRGAVKKNMLESLVSVMPCCVRGNNLVCLKQIYQPFLIDEIKSEEIPKEKKQHFLEQLATYYLLLGRDDLYQEKMTETQFPRENVIGDNNCSFEKDIEAAMLGSSDIFKVYDAIFSCYERHQSVFSDEILISINNEFIKLLFIAMRKTNIQKQTMKDLFLQLEKKAPKNPETSAYLALILYQLGFTYIALQKINQGLDLMSKGCSYVNDGQEEQHFRLAECCSIKEEECLGAKQKRNFRNYESTHVKKTESSKSDLGSFKDNVGSTQERDTFEQSQSDLGSAKNNAGSTQVKYTNEQSKSDHRSAKGNAGSTQVEATTEHDQALYSRKVVFYKLQKEFLDGPLQNLTENYLSSQTTVSLPTEMLLLYTKQMMKIQMAQGSEEAAGRTLAIM